MLSIRGVIHGKTIELDQEPGLPDGERVVVTVQRAERLPPGEGLRRAFGAWAEDAEELDRFMEWNREQRQISRPEIEV